MNMQQNQAKTDRRPLELWTPWGHVPKLGAWKKRSFALPSVIPAPRLPALAVKPLREA